jgi:hypothetical protein
VQRLLELFLNRGLAQKTWAADPNDGTTLFEEQNGRSTRARDHAYLARNWKFESIPLQR